MLRAKCATQACLGEFTGIVTFNLDSRSAAGRTGHANSSSTFVSTCTGAASLHGETLRGVTDASPPVEQLHGSEAFVVAAAGVAISVVVVTALVIAAFEVVTHFVQPQSSSVLAE